MINFILINKLDGFITQKIDFPAELNEEVVSSILEHTTQLGDKTIYGKIATIKNVEFDHFKKQSSKCKIYTY